MDVPKAIITTNLWTDVTQSTTERYCKDVKPPTADVPTEGTLFPKKTGGKPDHEFLKNHFSNEGRLTEDQALGIIHRATEILKKEPTILELESPLTVCGDLPGQYYDLLKLFEAAGRWGRRCS
ncbi:hypothetical protein BJ742DRAFT_894590 [Cladochytrium replicatum]|nr:hypothetical protein BJ742DRAFT_894590 [Cladochytrium replicatum]